MLTLLFIIYLVTRLSGTNASESKEGIEEMSLGYYIHSHICHSVEYFSTPYDVIVMKWLRSSVSTHLTVVGRHWSVNMSKENDRLIQPRTSRQYRNNLCVKTLSNYRKHVFKTQLTLLF